MKAKLSHITPLDGIRGLAAAMVFVVHFFQTLRDHPSAAQPAWWATLISWTGYGSYGVDVFFVLSGFLITSLLLADRQRPHYFWNFYWKRALRILPVYLLYLILAVWLMPHTFGYMVLSVLFLVNFSSRFHIDDVGPSWSLSIEEQFYLLWPHVIRRLRVRTIYQFTIAVIFLSFSLRFFILLAKGSVAIRFTPYRCDGLCMGALLACQYMMGESEQSPGVRRFLRVFHSSGALWVALAMAVGYCIAPTTPMLVPVELLLVNFFTYRLFRAIIASPARPQYRWLASPPLVYMGAISYSVYMFHEYAFILYDKYFGLPLPVDYKGYLIRFVVTAPSVLLVCTLSRYAFERPIQKLRRYVVRTDPVQSRL